VLPSGFVLRVFCFVLPSDFGFRASDFLEEEGPRMTVARWLALALMAGVAASAQEPKEAPTREVVRKAVAESLPLLVKSAAGHADRKTCFACHNQQAAVMVMTAAQARGLAVDEPERQRQLKFTLEFLARNRDNYVKGKGQGGQSHTAGAALWTLQVGGVKPDDTTAAVAEYLLQWQSELDHWKPQSVRPPSEGSLFSATAVSLRALSAYATPAQKDRADARRAKVLAWLLKTPARDTEDAVFRLMSLKYAGADAAALRTAGDDLLKRQQADGGWRQLDTMETDAYATGTALAMLLETGMVKPADAAAQSAVRFLLAARKPDGTWFVKTRSKPIQTYFETGFPYGKDQWISASATGWAAYALALWSD